MRATIAALLLTLAPLVTSAHGQTAPPRFWTAPYGAASLNDWPTPSHGRLGVRVALPFLGRLTFYPGLEIEPELAFSQAFLDLRFQPFAVPGAGSFWYVGGGLAAASNNTKTDLFTGVQVTPGSLRPFAELHFFGNLGNPSVDLELGFSIPIS